MLACQRALGAYVLTCQRVLHAYVLTFPCGNERCVLTSSHASVSRVLTCSRSSVLSFLTCSRVNVPSSITLINIHNWISWLGNSRNYVRISRWTNIYKKPTKIKESDHEVPDRINTETPSTHKRKSCVLSAEKHTKFIRQDSPRYNLEREDARPYFSPKRTASPLSISPNRFRFQPIWMEPPI